MSKTITICTLMLALILGGCATSAKRVKVKDAVPPPAQGEVAVFGGIRLVEEINIYLPNEEQDGEIYLVPDAGGKTVKISCYDGGGFGVYLPAGRYKVDHVDVDGYTFMPEVHLVVPAGYKAVYAGTILLDGTPTGIDPATGDSVFVYTVKDESMEFMDGLRKEAPGSEREVYKSLFRPDGALSTGDYPGKVFRAADIENDLQARTGAVEEVVKGGIVALTYFINPVWLFTIH